MILLVLAAPALSAALLASLCLTNPKRRRTAGLAETGGGTAARRALVAASLLPGLGFALAGDPAAFLMWIGGYSVIGWAVANGFAARRTPANPPGRS